MISSYSINVKNLTKSFDNYAVLKNITFKVKSNSIVGILGKNGAGKTTLLGLLMGIITPTSGTIDLLGKNLKNKKNEILKDINFQSPYVELPKKMTVQQNLFFYSRLYGVKNFIQNIEELSNDLKINELLKKSYGSLSAGQKTKVNLCKALLNKPKLLLLDEPTASLDPETSIFVRNYLIKYKKKNKSSILITSHNLDEIQKMCSSIILLKSGQIIVNGTINEIMRQNKYKSLIEFFLGKG
jgi:ABC-2 type transport system ATP-binding protein|tara:strand:+ start:2372 stop:3094 length:723 start_codon:yes stop_codon:yes gene_type:complete